MKLKSDAVAYNCIAKNIQNIGGYKKRIDANHSGGGI